MKIKFSKHTSIEEKKKIVSYYKNRKNQSISKNKKYPKPNAIKKRKKIPYNEYLKTYYWRKVRYLVLKRDNFRCTICGEREPLNVHHKTYINKGNEIKHLDDLITVCDLCHKKIHKNILKT